MPPVGKPRSAEQKERGGAQGADISAHSQSLRSQLLRASAFLPEHLSAFCCIQHLRKSAQSVDKNFAPYPLFADSKSVSTRKSADRNFKS